MENIKIQISQIHESQTDYSTLSKQKYIYFPIRESVENKSFL